MPTADDFRYDRNYGKFKPPLACLARGRAQAMTIRGTSLPNRWAAAHGDMYQTPISSAVMTLVAMSMIRLLRLRALDWSIR